MTTVAFDTLKFVDRLVESGMPEAQAKALAEAQAEISEAHLEDLVTKSDLRDELAPIHSDLRLLKWMMALVIITTVVPTLKSLFS
ncbi:MAG: DUF1640 domain-containing protein [Sedimenticola sp.]